MPLSSSPTRRKHPRVGPKAALYQNSGRATGTDRRKLTHWEKRLAPVSHTTARGFVFAGRRVRPDMRQLGAMCDYVKANGERCKRPAFCWNHESGSFLKKLCRHVQRSAAFQVVPIIAATTGAVTGCVAIADNLIAEFNPTPASHAATIPGSLSFLDAQHSVPVSSHFLVNSNVDSVVPSSILNAPLPGAIESTNPLDRLNASVSTT